jgi:hypothetical protein
MSSRSAIEACVVWRHTCADEPERHAAHPSGPSRLGHAGLEARRKRRQRAGVDDLVEDKREVLSASPRISGKRIDATVMMTSA